MPFCLIGFWNNKTMKPMLAKTYEDQDPTGWLISEKLDGVRAIWDGETLWTRTGNVIFAPLWFTSALPKVSLDGELWAGRGNFQKAVGIVRHKVPCDADWKSIKFMVFDAHESDAAFSDRLVIAKMSLAGNPVAELVEHITCKSRSHMDEVASELISLGAEGIMIKCPCSAYEQKRSSLLLKYKPFYTDEATVIGYDAGEGRNTGLVGSLVCTWNGVKFALGSLTDSMRLSPPKVGALVTFSYGGLTDSGTPRFPMFVTERNYE